MPQEQKIIPTGIQKVQKPIPTKLSEKNWAFSFEYFRQIEYFGLDRSEPKWFVSLLDRLKDLSQKERASIFSDRNTKTFYRYHKIDWASKNIPIKKSDLNWVKSVYLDNDEDYPFHQFQISTGNGRVIGFWNEDHTIFYIVLLDPLHNLQPSGNYNYAVDDCYPLSCEYSSLQNDIHNLMIEKPKCADCNIKLRISKIPTRMNQSTAIVGYLDNEFLELYEKVSHEKSLSEILQIGILNA